MDINFISDNGLFMGIIGDLKLQIFFSARTGWRERFPWIILRGGEWGRSLCHRRFLDPNYII
jgi:hypothetical protein